MPGRRHPGRLPPAALEAALDEYLASAALLTWRGPLAAAGAFPLSAPLGAAFAALAGIEADSRVIRTKIAMAGIDRVPVFRQFLVTWMAEEAEHARVLAAIAAHADPTGPVPARARPAVRDAITLVALRAGPPRVLYGTYGVLGAAQEYVALATYAELRHHCDNPAVRTLLGAIARQESHHMRFYLACARALLADRGTAMAVRRLLARSWRPPGVDLLGEVAHRQTFSFLLARPSFHRRLAGLDRVLGTVGGLEDLGLMARWLAQRKTQERERRGGVGALRRPRDAGGEPDFCGDGC